MKLFKLLPTIAATVIAASLTTVANAMPIEGILNMQGDAVITRAGNVATGDITSIDFLDHVDATNPGEHVKISTSTGSFAGLAGSFGTFNPDPWLITLGAGPFPALWTVGNFTFDLTAISTVSSTLVTGHGTLHNATDGFTSTAGMFSFSTQPFNLPTLSFSATTIPEPSAAALLGLGLVGLAIGRRRARK